MTTKRFSCASATGRKHRAARKVPGEKIAYLTITTLLLGTKWWWTYYVFFVWYMVMLWESNEQSMWESLSILSGPQVFARLVAGTFQEGSHSDLAETKCHETKRCGYEKMVKSIAFLHPFAKFVLRFLWYIFFFWDPFFLLAHWVLVLYWKRSQRHAAEIFQKYHFDKQFHETH